MNNSSPIKRLYIDIETSPNVVYSWRVGYKINLDSENIVEERSIVCIAYKWEGEKTVRSLQWAKRGDDKKMLEQFVPILESADEVVAHYGDRFDLPWIRARAAFHNIPVSPFIKSIDTKAQSSRLFYFNANNLDYLGQYLGLGKKIETDFKLWKNVMAGSNAALKKMVAYCKHDVILLERVYQRLKNYHVAKTHAAVLQGGERTSCVDCASTNTQRRGYRVTVAGTRSQIMSCSDCGRNFTVGLTKEKTSAKAAKKISKK